MQPQGRSRSNTRTPPRRYDPARALATSREHVSEPLEQRPVGHLGVHLVAAIVDDMRYARIGGRNQLQILMRVAG